MAQHIISIVDVLNGHYLPNVIARDIISRPVPHHIGAARSRFERELSLLSSLVLAASFIIVIIIISNTPNMISSSIIIISLCICACICISIIIEW